MKDNKMKLIKLANLLVIALIVTVAASGCRKKPVGLTPLPNPYAKNVKDLQVAWTFSTGVLRGHEGSPLVVGNVMYVHTPFPNIVYALDLDHGLAQHLEHKYHSMTT